jgi:hypothetical protein
LVFSAAIVAFGVAAAAPGQAAIEGAPDEEAAPVVVEMFLSQACKNCPPAAAISADLARRPDVVSLAWHIDYWNMLSNRKHGRWEDPFSRAMFADRQRAYNRNIRKRSTVFTPQAIINGEESLVGSKRDQVEEAIGAEREKSTPARIGMTAREDSYEVTILGEAPGPCEVFLITFHPSAVTDISSGDNAGLRFEEANVVSDVVRLGEVTMAANTFTAPRPTEGMGCAVIVQGMEQGRIYAARYCP